MSDITPTCSHQWSLVSGKCVKCGKHHPVLGPVPDDHFLAVSARPRAMIASRVGTRCTTTVWNAFAGLMRSGSRALGSRGCWSRR
jgi:hypothetical protein